MSMLIEVLQLLLLDIVFLFVFVVVALIPLSIYKRSAYAVLRRNFVGYFSNPTGYVFLCLFVALTSFAAFWPHEFFSANLANLDVLNDVLPMIMLVFIPAITMSIWADERRQGTDELLLTLPAGDFDIVIGKYLAAATIFTSSLVFSQISNYFVLVALSEGELDTGLFFSTYLGYWMMGVAMLSIGMVASFLTSNLTVGFILGMAFNVPLVLAYRADLILQTELARIVKSWSMGDRFDDFGRGVISLSSTVYFVAAMLVGLYLSMVLIGKRHWSGGRDGDSMWGHYLFRTVSLIVIALGLSITFLNFDYLRYDATEGKVASLSTRSKELIANLDPEHDIRIHAYISNDVPERYVQTKYDLISMLKEFGKASGKITLTLHDDLELFSEEASLAEEQYGIIAQQVLSRERGGVQDDRIIMGAAFVSGLDKVVVPFFDFGVPIEYEVARSIATVSKGRRAKLGVVRTDALLMGGVSMTMGRQIEKQSLITELEKQYDVEDVDPTNPIDIEKYDALLVAQPSSLSPAAFDNVMKAIEAGEPTAIFEDPRPLSFPWVIGTGDIKRAGGGSLGGGGRLVKPDMKKLWRLLGVAVQGDTGFDGQFRPNLVWQDSLPYPHLPAGFFEKEFVFANNTAPGGEGTLNSESQISSGLVEVLFPAPGQLAKTEDSEFEFVALAQTGAMSGMIKDEDFLRYFPRSPRELENARSGVVPDPIIIAARIRADAGKKQDEQDDDASGGDATSETRGIDVVYVADIDLLSSQFVELRAQRHNDMEWNFQNVTFALNVIDELARDNRFINIRKRRPKHYTLRLVEYQAEQARIVERNLQEQYEMEHRKAVAEQDAKMREEQERFQDEHDELQRKQREGSPDFDPTQLTKLIQEAQIKGEHAQRARDVKIAKLERTRDTQIERVRRQTELHILRIQNKFKFWAIVLPPIPPLLIGVIVWVVRRLREREGIAKTRLRV